MAQDKDTSFTVTVKYINGNTDNFELPLQGWSEAGNVASRLATFQQADKLVIELSSGLRVIPWSSILHLEINPCPPQIPSTVLKNATLHS